MPAEYPAMLAACSRADTSLCGTNAARTAALRGVPRSSDRVAQSKPYPYWAASPERLLDAFEATPTGLSSAEAGARLARFGPNVLKPRRTATRLRMLGRQVSNPLLGLLVFAAIVSGATGEWIDANICW